MRYFTVEWSGGGGWAHYAWLLADALGRDPRVESVLLTRERHELDEYPGRQRVGRIWRAAPSAGPASLRRVRIGMAFVAGWTKVVGIGLRTRRSGESAVFHVHGYEGVWPAVGVLLLRALGHQTVVTIHNPFPHDAPRWRRRLAPLTARIPGAVIAHTGETLDILGIGGTQTAVIRHPNYAPLAHLVGTVNGDSEKRSDAFRVAVIGHIKPYKGLDFVVEVFRRLVADGVDAELRIAGLPAGEASVREVLSRVPSRYLSCDLRYLTIEDCIAEALAADVLLLGHRSRSESGIGLLCLGLGTPVIGPRMGAIERMLELEPAWLFEPGDPDQAASALQALAAETRIDHPAVETRARALAKQAGSWEDAANRCIEMAGRVVSGGPRADAPACDGDSPAR